MVASRYDSNKHKLTSITDIYGLQQLITEPTRITSATLVDVIFTNCSDEIVCSGARHKVGTQYIVQSIQMICGHNGKGCFSLLLSTMWVNTRGLPWITSELKKEMHDRDILKIKACKFNDPFDWPKKKKTQNGV